MAENGTKWNKETLEKLQDVDPEIKAKLTKAIKLRAEAKTKEAEVKRLTEDANTMALEAFILADLDKVESEVFGSLVYSSGERSTLDKKLLGIKLVEAGVDAGLVAKCTKAATKTTPYESVTYRAPKL